MNFRQIIFIIIAIGAFLLFYSLDDATAVVPNWHITLPAFPGTGYDPFFCIVFFLGIAALYGRLPKSQPNNLWFATHALLSVLPLLYNRLQAGDFYYSDIYAHPQQAANRIELLKWAYYLFILNQATFIVYLLFVQIRGNGKHRVGQAAQAGR